MTQVTPSSVLNFEQVAYPDHIAVVIAEKWREWRSLRSKWEEEKKELLKYLFATDTRTTSNDRLPWSNSTTTPKLTQIRDNLHANYMANLFPNSDYLEWKAFRKEDKAKGEVIKSYIKTKSVQQELLKTASRLVSDYIDYGNCFAMVEWVDESVRTGDGELLPGYIGPRVVRISPFDIVFDPTAATFEQSPKIIKKIVSLGDIKRAIEENPEQNSDLQVVFDKMIGVRNIVKTTDSEISKADQFIADGFSSITSYYDTDYVELLTFYGNLFNHETGEYMWNRIITIADRAHVISNEEQPSWLGVPPVRHAGWRDRPDNLYSQGPLDNLVGLQYRIDHMENMKADVWDQIAYPTKVIRGEVDDFDDAPGSHIYVGDEGDVQYLAPDATALNADPQIDRILFLMEEMAGAPRQAMGFRTPGEKTAFEVDSLMNAANRIFRHKTAHLEAVFFEPLYNDMLEQGRRNMAGFETIEVEDAENGIVVFDDITKEDITARGKLFPMGARHIAERDTRLQNLQQAWQMKANDPSVGVHLSGKRIAEIIADELNERSIYKEYIGIEEQFEAQSIQEDAAVDFEEQQMEAADLGE